MKTPDRLRAAVAAKALADQELQESILEDLRARRPVGEIAEIIGHSREHVRRIARAHGIPTKGSGPV